MSSLILQRCLMNACHPGKTSQSKNNQLCGDGLRIKSHYNGHIIARTWKQPRCPSADEWIRKLWNIYTTEYYSAIKNAFESVLMRWMKLEPIIQSEVSQKEKHQYSILTHIYMEFKKMVTMTLYVKQLKRHRCKEQSFGLCRTRRGWDDWRE